MTARGAVYRTVTYLEEVVDDGKRSSVQNGNIPG